jgi:hypothetical protein
MTTNMLLYFTERKLTESGSVLKKRKIISVTPYYLIREYVTSDDQISKHVYSSIITSLQAFYTSSLSQDINIPCSGCFNCGFSFRSTLGGK